MLAEWLEESMRKASEVPESFHSLFLILVTRIFSAREKTLSVLLGLVHFPLSRLSIKIFKQNKMEK